MEQSCMQTCISQDFLKIKLPGVWFNLSRNCWGLLPVWPYSLWCNTAKFYGKNKSIYELFLISVARQDLVIAFWKEGCNKKLWRFQIYTIETIVNTFIIQWHLRSLNVENSLCPTHTISHKTFCNLHFVNNGESLTSLIYLWFSQTTIHSEYLSLLLNRQLDVLRNLEGLGWRVDRQCDGEVVKFGSNVVFGSHSFSDTI